MLAGSLAALALGLAWWQRPPADRLATTQIVTADSGQVEAIDAETLRLGDRVVRLAGIVAPSRDAACRLADKDCAAASAHALATMLARRSISCAVRGSDARGRAVAVCSAGDIVLNDRLVAEGWAHAARDDARLAGIETTARDAGRGLWRSGDW